MNLLSKLNKCIIRTILLVLCLHVFSDNFAQDFSNKGKEFWVVFPPHAPTGGNLANLSLYISSEQNTNGYIVIGGDSTPFNVFAFTPREFVLDRTKTYVSGAESATDANQTTLNKIVSNKGIKVVVAEGQPKIVVYAHIYASARSAASIILPTNVLERRYQVMSFTQSTNTVESGETRRSQFNVIAVEDNTTIRVQLRKNGNLSGTSYEINLPNAGDIYSFQDNVDLTGTSIESISSNGNLCKKIAVFSGSSSLQIGPTSGSVDPLFQQCYPMNSWGLNYFITPFATKNKFIVRVLAREDNTSVVVNGQAATVLNANQFRDYTFTSPLSFSINADKAICVAQYSYTQAGDIGIGDPDMVILNPIEQNLNDATVFLTTKKTITSQNINVVIRDEGISSFRINGQLPNNAFIKIPNTAFSYLQESFNVVANSFLSVRLTSDSGFNAFCYGFGQVESYMYSAGTNVKDLFQKLLITNKFASVTSEALTCTGTPFNASITLPYKPLTIKWKIPNYSQIDEPSPMPFDSLIVSNKIVYTYKLNSDISYSNLGTYNFQVIVNNPTADGCSGEQELSFDLVVAAPPTTNQLIVSSNCLSDSVQISDATILGPNDRVLTNFKWDIGTGVFIDTLSNIKYQYGLAGQYTIRHFVINDIGCVSDTVATILKVDANPILSFQVNSVICQNENVQFDNTTTIPNGTIIRDWIWDYGDFSSKDSLTSSANVLHRFDSLRNYNVTLRSITFNGCRDSLTQTILNHPKPMVGFRLPKLCLDDTNALFTDTTKIEDQSNGFRYRWDFGDILNQQHPNTDTVANPIHRYILPGNYPVSLVVTSSAGCMDSVTSNYTLIGSKPNASFKVIDSLALCSNKVLKLENQSSTTIGAISRMVVYWDFDRNQQDTTLLQQSVLGATIQHQYQNYSYPSRANYAIKLVAYTANTCLDDSIETVEIHPTPIVGFKLPKLCLDDTNALFTDTTSIVDQSVGFRYRWNFGDVLNLQFSNTDTVANPIHRYILPGTYPVKLEVTSNVGCVDSLISNYTILGSKPISSFKVVDELALCSNKEVKIENNSKAGIGAIDQIIVYWNYEHNQLDKTIVNQPAEGTTIRHQYQNYLYPDSTRFMIKLSAYSASTCSDDATRSIDIVPPPSALQVLSSKDYVCFADSLHLNSIVVGGAPPFEFTWNSNDNQVGDFTSNVLKGINPGTVTASVTITDQKKCVYTFSNVKQVIVKSLPVAVLSVKDSVICNDSPIVLKGIGGGTYNWLRDNSPVQVSAIDTLTTNAPGAYQLIVKDSYCSSVASQKIKLNAQVTPMVGFTHSAYSCINGYLVIQTDATAANNVGYLWDYGDGMQSNKAQPGIHTYKQIGAYQVKLNVSNPYCPNDAYEIIGAPIKVIAPLPPSTFTLFVLSNQDSLFSPHKVDSGYVQYQWYPSTFLSATGTASPIFRGDHSISYTLSRTDPNTTCQINDVYNVLVSEDVLVAVPTAFTPNNDNINDVLKIEHGAGIKTLNYFRIFNRFGKIVFQSNQLYEGWDGKFNGIDQEMDAYSYIIDYLTYKDVNVKKTGSVILMR